MNTEDKKYIELGLLATDNKLEEEYMQHKETGARILITSSPYEVASRIKNSKESLRILYDDNIKEYMVCYHENIIHYDMIKTAIDYGYYSSIPDIKYTVDSYIDDNRYEEEKLFYLIFAPTDKIDDTYGARIPEDDYSAEYYYDFGVITSRDCDFTKCPLYKALGKPIKVRERTGWDDNGQMIVSEINESTNHKSEVASIDKVGFDIDELNDLVDKLEREGYNVWVHQDSYRGVGFNLFGNKLTNDNDVFYFFNVDLFEDDGLLIMNKTLNPNILTGKQVEERHFKSVPELDKLIHDLIEKYMPQNSIIDVVESKEDVEEDLTDDEQHKLEEIDQLITDIYTLRQDSIKEDGEFGIGNLVFKEFRNIGYLDNLKRLKRQLQSKDMSLENLEEDK